MKPIGFPEQTLVMAENQPAYTPLPVHRFDDAEGRLCCCWSLSWRERFRVLFTGLIWHQMLTFNQPLQPQLLTTEKPAMEEALK